MNYPTLLHWLRRPRCGLRLSHRWPEHPEIIGTRTIQRCRRCGKTIERDWR